MASVSNSFRDTVRLFGRHERVSTSLLFIVILLTCLHAQVVDGRVLFLVAVLVVWPFVQTRLQWLYHRQFGLERSAFPAILLDAVLIGVCISITQFSIVPSLVFAGTLLLSLMAVTSVFGWVVVLVLAMAATLISSYFLGYSGAEVQQTPVLVTVVSMVALLVSVVVELVGARHRVQIAERQLVEAQAKTTHFMNVANKIARYAPSQVWQSILRGDRDARIENKRKKLTIFFSDIQGFTELSETLLPDDLATILNTYFEHMSDLAKKYGGTIDKFIGDALLIFFGDPTSKGAKNDALACVEMAIAMRRENKLLRQKWKALGFDGLHVRMGITTGYCHVGNFGSNSRMSYTIIGRDANLAARLQTAANPDEILISNDTYLLIRDKISCRERGMLHLKGIAKPMQTWEVLDQFESSHTLNRRWVEFEMDGFNLQLNMDEVKSYDRERILGALQQAARNLDQHVAGDGQRPPH